MGKSVHTHNTDIHTITHNKHTHTPTHPHSQTRTHRDTFTQSTHSNTQTHTHSRTLTGETHTRLKNVDLGDAGDDHGNADMPAGMHMRTHTLRTSPTRRHTGACLHTSRA